MMGGLFPFPLPNHADGVPLLMVAVVLIPSRRDLCVRGVITGAHGSSGGNGEWTERGEIVVSGVGEGRLNQLMDSAVGVCLPLSGWG